MLSTPNYGLKIYEPTDPINLETGYNNSMTTLDNNLLLLHNDCNAIKSTLDSLQNDMNGSTVLRAEQITYNATGVSGSCLLSANRVKGANIATVTYNNATMTINSSVSTYVPLYILPADMHPLSTHWQTICYYPTGARISLMVTWDGIVRLSVINSNSQKTLPGNFGASIAFVCQEQY